MNGRATTRGIFLQALVCLLEALQSDNNWESLALEPDLEAEKVDIIWRYSDGIKVTQVKSSQNQLNVPDARKWASELEGSYESTNYELILIGPSSGELSKGQTYGMVEVPSPKPLDIQGLIEQAAHRLARYLENQEKSAGSASTRENVVDSLVGRYQRYSISGMSISMSDFEALLNEWVQDAFNNLRRPSKDQLQVLEEKIYKQMEMLPHIRTLNIDHPESIHWRRTIERYMHELDEYLPGNNFENQRASIPWHEPNKRATERDYERGCDATEGLLRDALQILQETIFTMGFCTA